MNGIRPLPILLALVIGIAIGAAGVLFLTPMEETTSPTAATSTATGCSDEPLPQGWLAQIADEDARLVVLNVSIGHEAPGLDLTSSLDEVAEGTFRFAITSAPSTEKADPPTDCQPRTTVEAVISLPADYETLEIAIDDDPLATVKNTEESFPSIRRVPPVER